MKQINLFVVLFIALMSQAAFAAPAMGPAVPDLSLPVEEEPAPKKTTVVV